MPISVSYLFEKIRSYLPKEEIQLQGILQKNDKYFVLIDEKDKEYKVNILSRNLDTVPLNSFITVKGIPVYPTSKSGLWVNFNVGEIEKVNEEDYQHVVQMFQVEEMLPQKSFSSLYEIINSKITQNSEIRFAVIHGRNAQTHKDFEKALKSEIGNYLNYVNVDFFETSLTDNMLVQKIGEIYKDYDFLMLVRGGGSKEELQAVGGFETAKFIIQNNIPFFIALGHSLDKGLTIMEKVADGSFSTPSIAGTEVGKVIKNVITIIELQSHIKIIEKMITESSKEKEYLKEKVDMSATIINNLQQEKDNLIQQNNILNKSLNKNMFYNVLFFIMGFIICFIMVKLIFK